MKRTGRNNGKGGNLIVSSVLGLGVLGAVGFSGYSLYFNSQKFDSFQEKLVGMVSDQQDSIDDLTENQKNMAKSQKKQIESMNKMVDKVEDLEEDQEELERRFDSQGEKMGSSQKNSPNPNLSQQKGGRNSVSNNNEMKSLVSILPDDRTYQFNGNTYTKKELSNMSEEELEDMRVLKGENGPIVEGVPYKLNLTEQGVSLTLDREKLKEDSQRNLLETILGMGRYNEYYSAEDIIEAANDGRVYAVDGEDNLHRFTEEGISKFLYQTEAFMRAPTKYLENKTDGIPLLRNLTDMTDEATGSVVSIPHRFWNSGKNMIYGEKAKEEVDEINGKPGRNGYMPGNRWKAAAEFGGASVETYLLINAFSGSDSSSSGNGGGSGGNDPSPVDPDPTPTFGGESGFYNGAN